MLACKVDMSDANGFLHSQSVIITYLKLEAKKTSWPKTSFGIRVSVSVLFDARPQNTSSLKTSKIESLHPIKKRKLSTPIQSASLEIVSTAD